MTAIKSSTPSNSSPSSTKSPPQFHRKILREAPNFSLPNSISISYSTYAYNFFYIYLQLKIS